MKKLSSVIRALNSIIPKDKKSIYCRSTFLYPDNTDAVISAILDSDKDYKIYCEEPVFIYSDKRIKPIRSKASSVYHYLRSKYVIWDTGMFGNPKPVNTQITVNLWHGVSFKKIGYYLTPQAAKTPTSTYVVTYSDLFVDVMSAAFGVDRKNILTTGEPRNDYLFRPVDDSILEKIGINTNDQNKIVIWMPTYRQSKYGNSNDGKQYDFGFPIVGADKLEELNDICKRLGIVLILKWHALQVLPDFVDQKKLGNLVFLTSEMLSSCSIPLYCVLPRCDALITDYSSVFINYMLLDKPIGFAYDDIDYYKNNRGFMFEDIESLMPGVRFNDYAGLVSFLEEIAEGKDSSIEQRKALKYIMNAHYDGKNSQRLLRTIGIL